ncbi:MAG: hypothetical protein ACI91J_003333, partial [Yoonia sp.]
MLLNVTGTLEGRARVPLSTKPLQNFFNTLRSVTGYQASIFFTKRAT